MSAQTTFGIRELAERAKKEGAIDLAQGVIQTAPPAVLGQSLRDMSIDHASRYNNKRGVLEFREAIQTYLGSQAWKLPLENIIGTAGVTGGIAAALLTDCRPGDTVLLPEPFFIGHKLLLEALGFKIKFWPMPLVETPDWYALAALMNDVQAVILTTPANPTGHYIPAQELQRLGEAAAATHCLLLVDEMYRDFIWHDTGNDDQEYNKFDLHNMVIMRSFSKSLAIPGWRVGYVMTAAERIETMAAHHDALYLGGSTIAQYALAEALVNHLPEINEYIANLRKLLQENMVKLTAAFTDYGMAPLPVPATYYMLMRHNRASDIAAMEELIAKKIVTTPLSILYSHSERDTGYIRVHFGISEKTCDRVVAVLQS